MSKIVLIGAGSAQFGYGTLGEIFATQALSESEVVLLDIDPTALQRVSDAAVSFVAEQGLKVRLSATTDRTEALDRADFVVISIEVGDRFKLWEQDWQVPQQYGIRQVYAENGGPGGLFHSLRIIPPILEICEDIQRICPEALVFNYSNPMSRICTTVHRNLPELNFVGLCHEVASLERYLPTILGVPFEELEVTAAGLNHFSCLLEARYRRDGRDAYPDIRAKAPEFFARIPGASDYLEHFLEKGRLIETEGFVKRDPSVHRSTREWTERRLFQMVLERLDLLPITTDSHFGEYTAWAFDAADHRGILDFYRYYKLGLAQAQPKIELRIHERVVPIIEAIVENSELWEAAVNVPNQGFIKELPDGLAVEVPGLVNGNGVHGQNAPPLTPAFAGMLQNQVAIHQMTAEAVLSKSKKAVVQALMVDPVVDKARCLPELVDVMVSLQREYLGYLQ